MTKSFMFYLHKKYRPARGLMESLWLNMSALRGLSEIVWSRFLHLMYWKSGPRKEMTLGHPVRLQMGSGLPPLSTLECVSSPCTASVALGLSGHPADSNTCAWGVSVCNVPACVPHPLFSCLRPWTTGAACGDACSWRPVLWGS